jgi:hypothetical protein
MTLRSNFKIYFCNVVWGAEYLEFFLAFNIPSLLAELNIPSLGKDKCTFFIYTKEEHVETIKNSSSIKILEGYVDIKIVTRIINSHDKHVSLSSYHKEFLRNAVSNKAIAFFLSPDTIWSNGSLSFAYQKFLEGNDCLFVPGLRVNKEPAIKDLHRISAINDNICTLSPRALVDHALGHLHKNTLEYFYCKGTGASLSPSVLIWRISKHCLGLRSFHQHPLFIFCNDLDFSFRSTIDFDLGMYLIRNSKKYYIVKDSDEMVVVEYSSEKMIYKGILPKQLASPVGKWASEGNSTNELHWNLVQTLNLFHCEDVESQLIQKLLKTSNEVIENIAFYAFLNMRKSSNLDINADEKSKLLIVKSVFQRNRILKEKYYLILFFEKNFRIFFKLQEYIYKIILYIKNCDTILHYQYINMIMIKYMSLKFKIFIGDVEDIFYPRYILILLKRGFLSKIKNFDDNHVYVCDRSNICINKIGDINNKKIIFDKFNDIDTIFFELRFIQKLQKIVTQIWILNYKIHSTITKIFILPLLIIPIIIINCVAYLFFTISLRFRIL